MKTTIARMIALCAFALLIALPQASQAQQTFLNINAYFSNNTATLSFLTGATATESGVQGSLSITAPQGKMLMIYTSLRTSKNSRGSRYAQITGGGYWEPTGSSQAIPCLVTASFVQMQNGQGTGTITITNYNTKALVFASGAQMLRMAGTNGIAIGVSALAQ